MGQKRKKRRETANPPNLRREQAVTASGDELPPNFVTRKLLIANSEQNTDVLKQLLRSPKYNDAAILAANARQLEIARRRAPVAVYREIDAGESYFTRPRAYIRHRDVLPDEVDVENDPVEYEMDSEDETWLDDYNERVPSSQQINEDLFEELMDRLEKEAFLHAESNISLVAAPDEVDEHAIVELSDCCVCQEGLSEDANQIVLCDGCDLAVHQCCYGLRVIPEGEWYCDACKERPGDALRTKCALCDRTGGAFKRAGHDWVHVQCAYYLPELAFEEPDCGGKLYYKTPISQRRRQLRCTICSKKGGAPVQCCHPGCAVTFHVTCGQSQRHVFALEERNDNWFAVQYCAKHTPIDQLEKRKKNLEKDKQMMELSTARNAQVKRVQRRGVSSSDAVRYCGGFDRKLAQRNFKRRFQAPIVLAVYKHWSQRRIKRRGMALLRRLTPSILNSGLREADAGTFRCSSRRMVPVQELAVTVPKLQQWRLQLDQTRAMLELIKEREQRKLDLARNVRDRFEALFSPLERKCRFVLDLLTKEDSNSIFADPVTPDIAPDYYKIVRRPMDFFTIESKITTSQYKNEQQFFADVLLCFDNAQKYNPSSSLYHQEAVRLRALVESWIASPDSLPPPDRVASSPSISLSHLTPCPIATPSLPSHSESAAADPDDDLLSLQDDRAPSGSSWSFLARISGMLGRGELSDTSVPPDDQSDTFKRKHSSSSRSHKHARIDSPLPTSVIRTRRTSALLASSSPSLAPSALSSIASVTLSDVPSPESGEHYPSADPLAQSTTLSSSLSASNGHHDAIKIRPGDVWARSSKKDRIAMLKDVPIFDPFWPDKSQKQSTKQSASSRKNKRTLDEVHHDEPPAKRARHEVLSRRPSRVMSRSPDASSITSQRRSSRARVIVS